MCISFILFIPFCQFNSHTIVNEPKKLEKRVLFLLPYGSIASSQTSVELENPIHTQKSYISKMFIIAKELKIKCKIDKNWQTRQSENAN